MSTTKTVIQDRYELKERLFSEGNQAAYLARDSRRNEDVLLFLVPPASKLAESVDRAVRAGIERAFAVESPTLLPLLDLSEAGDYRFLVMPMPRGTNAWTRITQKAAGKRLGAAAALRAADDLIAAARAAEEHGTILGFSPKQVWIEEDGSVDVQYYWLERVYLHGDDFGLPEQAGIKTLGVEGGYFQAPELSAGRSGAAAPADQFFIAAILYGLLTGEVPGGTLAPIRRSRGDVPKPVAKGIERALAQDPAQRHADLEAFRRSLYKEPAKLGHLVPLLLLLVGLWAGFALFLGGADLDDWAFPAEMDARRQSAFEQSRPTAEPVPRAEDEVLRKFRGTYATATKDGAAAELELHLGADASFLLTDRTRDEVRRSHGLWWREAGGTALVLMPVGADARRGAALRIEPGDNTMRLEAPEVAARTLQKVGWQAEAGATPVALLRLDEPLVGAVLSEGEVRVAGRVAVPDTAVTVQGAAANVVGTRFDAVIKLGAADRTEIVVEATAPDGFRSTVRRAVRFDASAPQVEATARLQETGGVWELLVSGRCSDASGVEAVTVNDEVVPVQPDGSFVYERKGAPALRNAFTEVVAVDKAGRAARRLLWPHAPTVGQADVVELFEQARTALAEDRTADAGDALRKISQRGGLIEDPEHLSPAGMRKLAYGDLAPQVILDALPPFFVDDGTRTVTITGSVEAFLEDDKLLVQGQAWDVVDGRFTARPQLAELGANAVRILIRRRAKDFDERVVPIRLAAGDGDVPSWTDRAVSDAQREASARHGLPIGRTEHGMRFVLIPEGSFFRETEDGTPFEVRISKPYYMQVREVSRADYEKFTGESLPTVYEARSGNLPIASAKGPASGMTRAQIEAFAQGLSRAGKGAFRLPTEAEWELAARAGDTDRKDYWGGDTAAMVKWANFADLSIRRPRVLPNWPERLLEPIDDGHPGPWPVGTGRANAWGLRDMLGNVAEWTADYFRAYDRYEREDPRGPSRGTQGVVRGGGFTMRPDERGVAARFAVDLSDAPRATGFRLVLEAERR